jgi:hypothetical protein
LVGKLKGARGNRGERHAIEPPLATVALNRKNG